MPHIYSLSQTITNPHLRKFQHYLENVLIIKIDRWTLVRGSKAQNWAGLYEWKASISSIDNIFDFIN